MDAMQDHNNPGASEASAVKPGGGDKVVCFVSKRKVDRGQAKQVRHPKEGLVWVSAEFIK